jgi:paraquat-inducible protein B
MIPPSESEAVRRGRIRQFVDKGLRAQLRSGNLLTGQLYVALDFFPDAPKVKIDVAKKLPEIPTMPGTIEELQETLTGIVKKIDKLQIEEIGTDLRKALASADETLKGADALLKRLDTDLVPDLRRTLDNASLTLKNAENVLAAGSPLQSDLLETLREVNRTLTSVRALADYLQQHPDSLIFGKPAPSR